LIESDKAQGFYLFRPNRPLAPGETLKMRWALVRENRGFPNSDADNEIIGNGSYLRGGHIPLPGYCTGCQLTSNRERFGLPPSPRLPDLGDPAHLDDLWQGIDSRSGFHVVIGTDADQTAVSAGVLRRTWEASSRRYFEYSLDGPVWPLVPVQSARYAVARDSWNGVSLEVYHHPTHAWNVQAMLDTAKKGLSYYSREFAPYQLPYYRIVEYARYRTNVQAGVGTIAYSEGSGFMADLRDWYNLDYATLHELAHQWWGNVYGARMQGRQLLNEGLAQYSTLMAYKEFADPVFARRILASMHDGYLDARSSETVAEQPLLLTEDQGYLSYYKAPLALFALQELIGADKVNGALRTYHNRFVEMKPPFPTSRDLVNELRAAAGSEYQDLITDLFERIVLYDVAVTAARIRPVADGYEVVLDVAGQQFEANGQGAETEVPLDAWFQVAVFPASEHAVVELQPSYLQHHRLRSGKQRITVRVAKKPGAAAIDPFRLMIDRRRYDNLIQLPIEP
jgi:ABC-2 type transport system permease protein